MSEHLVVTEIYRSIQGESSYAGLPCTFVRLTGCNLRCVWCDSAFSFHGGERLGLDEVVRAVAEHGTDLVELTGGEPLLQPAVHPLMARLVDAGATVLLETTASMDLAAVDPRVVKIVDVKCPASGESRANRAEVLDALNRHDEVKFVVADRADYEYARAFAAAHRLAERVTVLVGVVHGALEPRELAEWVVADRWGVRLQLQLHKYIWDPDARGV